MFVKELPLFTKGRSGGGRAADGDSEFQTAVGNRLEMEKMTVGS